jgi:hypothetical protein
LSSVAALASLAGWTAGCRHKSKLDVDRAADVDRLWDLAPDQEVAAGLEAEAQEVGLRDEARLQPLGDDFGRRVGGADRR